MSSKKNLSKSRIMSAQQCQKRLYLELNHPGLAEISASTQAAFDTGRQVGDIAQTIYGKGTLIDYGPGLRQAIADTSALMTVGSEAPIYEATFEFDGVLVRVDVLLPVGGGCRIIEVKSSTKLKDEHLQDSAIQAWVFGKLGYPLKGIALAHVDNTFVYQGEGDYRGLLVEHDIAEQVGALLPRVAEWIEFARNAVANGQPNIPPGAHCNKPYACAFKNHCWPMDTEYPITGLGGGLAKLGQWVEQGYRDIRDVPVAQITSPSQLRIHSVTCEGTPELLPQAAEWARSLAYPRYYLDFETVGPAVPVWPGTRPYETLAIQWSCHIEEGPGQVRHEEFLDLSGEPPMRALAETMLKTLGSQGPILMYTNYERGVILGLAERFPDLALQLEALVERLEDLHPPTKNYFYHPKMLGSWSIKAVMPNIEGGLDYKDLEGIKEGTTASNGFLEAIHPDTAPERKAELNQQLRKYCWVDTEAMVRLVNYLAGA